MPTSTSDEDCLTQIRDGHLPGLSLLYARHHRPVLAAATTLAGRHIAGALTEEAFGGLLQLVRDGGQLGSTVRYYLYASVRESYRRRVDLASHGRLGSGVLPTPFDAPDDEESRLLADAFRSLPATWRRALWLRTFEGLDERGVGDALALDLRAASSLCRSAEAALRIVYVAAHLPAQAPVGEFTPDRPGGRAAGGP